MPRSTVLAATALLGAVAVAELVSGAPGSAAATRVAGPAPQLVVAKVRCVVTSYETVPGYGSVPLYQPKVIWKVRHASGLALSVDDPNLVGAYGIYGRAGSILLGGGCYTDDGTTTITFDTVGGHGRRAHRTIKLVGRHNHIVAPPFS